jgi:hypothetical protein
MTFPEELRSCREGTSYFIRPQNLGDSTYKDDAPEEAGGDPVPRACTFCFRSFLFQILTRFSYKPAARNGFEAVLTHVPSHVMPRPRPVTVGGCGRVLKSAKTSTTHRTPHRTYKAKEPMVQAAGYAAEIMSKQTMTHTHGCVIEG